MKWVTHNINARGRVSLKNKKALRIILEMPALDVPKRYEKYDLTGKKFGKLKVVRLIARNSDDLPRGILNKKTKKSTNYYWLCKCDCGNYKVASGGGLRSGVTRSCGCMTKKLPRGEASFNKIFGKYKRFAARQGRTFKLTKRQ